MLFKPIDNKEKSLSSWSWSSTTTQRTSKQLCLAPTYTHAGEINVSVTLKQHGETDSWNPRRSYRRDKAAKICKKSLVTGTSDEAHHLNLPEPQSSLCWCQNNQGLLASRLLLNASSIQCVNKQVHCCKHETNIELIQRSNAAKVCQA